MQPLFVAELMMLSACAHAGASDVETACCGEVHELKLQCVKPRHCGPRIIQVHLVLVRLAAKQHQHWILLFLPIPGLLPCRTSVCALKLPVAAAPALAAAEAAAAAPV